MIRNPNNEISELEALDRVRRLGKLRPITRHTPAFSSPVPAPPELRRWHGLLIAKTCRRIRSKSLTKQLIIGMRGELTWPFFREKNHIFTLIYTICSRGHVVSPPNYRQFHRHVATRCWSVGWPCKCQITLGTSTSGHLPSML